MRLLKPKWHSLTQGPENKLVGAFAGLLICACASPIIYPRHTLYEQILRPRLGYHGLTNRACSAWDTKNGCVNYVIEDHVLTDDAFRQSLNAFRFICNVAGRRFKVCEDKPGLCRITWSGFFNMHRNEEYVDFSERYQFLLDAKTSCFSRDLYPFEGA